MGEYEPNDSRNVTQNPNRSGSGIEPERTGPKEDEVRRKAQQDAQEKERREQTRQAEQSDYDQTQTNEPQAIKNDVGVSRPVYDQYEVNQPGSINGEAQSDTQPMQQQQQQSGDKSREPMTENGPAQSGYGNSRDADGREEQDEVKKTPSGYTQMQQQKQQGRQAPGDRRDPQSASPPQVSHDMPDEERAIPGEISSQPDKRAIADANPVIMDEEE
ncbi:hypothetical protein GRI38_11400 [Altererythrobacter aurantiacus]|uniref:Uncharacterized protein n=1 Tax=Parapontixanthobacter aurantiacus TaxID=1463599 RepID=A0A844ZI16_9SPHN|nr:hypothetical protein [Parapontixanthobacter aurantiacus]MXO86630.1 hypothetical protein [Parapontixanthobacter aurantiacus]